MIYGQTLSKYIVTSIVNYDCKVFIRLATWAGPFEQKCMKQLNEVIAGCSKYYPFQFSTPDKCECSLFLLPLVFDVGREKGVHFSLFLKKSTLQILISKSEMCSAIARGDECVRKFCPKKELSLSLSLSLRTTDCLRKYNF